MRILVFDSNVVFSKTVGKAIGDHVPSAIVDYARNPSVLKDRVASEHFDIILADISTTRDTEEALSLLRMAREKGATVFVWACLDHPTDNLASFTALAKPKSSSELEKVVDDLVTV